MDMKIHGLTFKIIEQALAQTHRARNYILDEVMLKAIPEPRKELSPYAPKMATMTIDVDKIAAVIGKGGKVIKKIIEDSQCLSLIHISTEIRRITRTITETSL